MKVKAKIKKVKKAVIKLDAEEAALLGLYLGRLTSSDVYDTLSSEGEMDSEETGRVDEMLGNLYEGLERENLL